MTTLEKLLKMQINELALKLMKEDTGLPMVIWCPRDEMGIQHQQPYIAVALNNSNRFVPQDSLSISIEKEPKYFKSIKGYKRGEVIGGSWFNPVKDFILKNYDLLLSHWNESISDGQFLNRIEKV